MLFYILQKAILLNSVQNHAPTRALALDPHLEIEHWTKALGRNFDLKPWAEALGKHALGHPKTLGEGLGPSAFLGHSLALKPKATALDQYLRIYDYIVIRL